MKLKREIRKPIKITVRPSELVERSTINPYKHHKKKKAREKLAILTQDLDEADGHFGVFNVIGLVLLFIYQSIGKVID